MSGAAKEMHHNFRGGLLYHTYRMLLQAKALSEIYQDLDKEVLYSAVALRDIGKIHEMETSEYGAAEYTAIGSMLGHVVRIATRLYMPDSDVIAGDAIIGTDLCIDPYAESGIYKMPLSECRKLKEKLESM